MDTRNGNLVPMENIPELEKEHFVPVKRDLTERERFDHKIKLYSPCGCGSGKKFKFCCYVGKQMHDFMRKLA